MSPKGEPRLETPPPLQPGFTDAPAVEPAFPFPGMSGRGVRIAVIDSGVHYPHPHIVQAPCDGVWLDMEGEVVDASWTDRIGHGTAVMAAIQERAPAAEYLAVKVFGSRLATSAQALVAGIDWACLRGAHLINLSLGSLNEAHRELFASAIARAAKAGALIVAARSATGRPCLPGVLDGVCGVEDDVELPRTGFYCASEGRGWLVRASRLPRPVPGVPVEHNLSGISFAVANASGILARAIEAAGGTGGLGALLRAESHITGRQS